MICLFIGRVQPFHNGHLKAIKYILKSCDYLIILIGSAQKSHEGENPFTVGERMEMISRSLARRSVLQRCRILPITDIGHDELWVPHVISSCRGFDALYTNNELIERLFTERGFTVKKIPFFSRNSLEATKIRRAIRDGGAWKKYVPKEVAEFLLEINAKERISSA